MRLRSKVCSCVQPRRSLVPSHGRVDDQFFDVTTSELANVFALLGQLSTPLTSEDAVESHAKTNPCLRGRVGVVRPGTERSHKTQRRRA